MQCVYDSKGWIVEGSKVNLYNERFGINGREI